MPTLSPLRIPWISQGWTAAVLLVLFCLFLFFFQIYTQGWNFLDIYPGVGHMVILVLVFKKPPYCFSQWLHQFISPPTTFEGSLFSTSLPTFVICRLFDWQSSWQVWGGISLWFWFALPWWLVILGIFSCVCWLSAFSLGKISIQFLCQF